ncbi:mechanosensitive ion channel family protein [Subtercola boreus]|uniref:Mechanosensitive ion channel protein MscS n=1 Tax=Subtercola boreus TaxID=120213 RepID=A0A3E0W9E2_9MICO|nr:mechanosensitive ion channel domain-containing protein [Subtercola boreus]RFA17966.1 mechanosensitive ion channel protein MscS [Subtercola boreus]RFA18348.1 mechanosensitive ion channel protein MscS [Subtercola boreus]RFA24877.1 mechanosensitive ion channel protein MscS [Subtercola boreus]
MTDFIAGITSTPWLQALVYIAIAIVCALVVTALTALIVRRISRRKEWAVRLIRRARVPFRVFLLVIALWIALQAMTSVDPWWREFLSHTALIASIATGAWLFCALAIFLEDLGLARYRTDVPDNRHARRLRTQVLIIRRVTVVAGVLIALGAILLTFPGVSAAGASLLASAGLISIVAGLAAQSTLANVFAGMQLAFSDAIRVDDVVIVETEWGRIEEITLTYVVVHLWDDRRMVLPSTYFTTTPFQNWTRKNSELMGSVDFDLDWRVDPDGMRDELHRVMNQTELWDGRVAILQVTDAVGGFVHIRILVTAVDAPTLFDLRCFVREQLVRWVQQVSPLSVPRTRVEHSETPLESDVPRSRTLSTDTLPDALFSGDASAALRGAQFTGPLEVPRAARVPREPAPRDDR